MTRQFNDSMNMSILPKHFKGFFGWVSEKMRWTKNGEGMKK